MYHCVVIVSREEMLVRGVASDVTDRSLVTETTSSSMHAVLVSIMTYSLETEQLITDKIDACYSPLIHMAILYGTCCLLTR